MATPSPHHDIMKPQYIIGPATSSSSTLTTVPTIPPTGFHSFAELPKELQQKVWLLTFPVNRRIPLDVFRYREPRSSVGPPPSYSMNRASRAFTLKHYHMLWEWVDWSFYPFSEGVEHIFFNPAKDILTLNFNTLIRSDFPEYTNAHARVIFLLHNNPKRQIIDQVEILEVFGVTTSLFEIKDFASEALGILEYFPGLKELRILDVPLPPSSPPKPSCWLYRRVVLRLAYCFAILEDRGKIQEMPKIIMCGMNVDVEKEYGGFLRGLAKAEVLGVWERMEEITKLEEVEEDEWLRKGM